MKYYSVAEMVITNRGWVPEYVKNVTRMVEQHGARFLARTSNVERLEGERKLPQVFLIIEWPSKEAAQKGHDAAWRESVRKRTGSEPVIRYFDLLMVVDNANDSVTEWTTSGEAQPVA